MTKYELLKEIEPGDSLPIGTILDIEGDYCRLDNDQTIPIERLITHGYLKKIEVEKDKYEECIKLLKLQGTVCNSESAKYIIKSFFPPTDTDKVTRFEVIDHRAKSPTDIPRAISIYGIKAELSYQDDGKTLKVFLTDRE